MEKIFEAKGKLFEKKLEKKFSKKVRAVNEKFAAEKVFALFGSKNKIKRRHIKIEEIKEAKENG